MPDAAPLRWSAKALSIRWPATADGDARALLAAPAASLADMALRSSIGADRAVLRDEVAGHFARVLDELLAPHVATELALWHVAHGWGFAPRPAGDGSAWPEGFAAHLRQDGLAGLLERLPPLSALLERVIALEIAAIETLLGHLAADRARLAAHFGLEDCTPVSLRPGLSDAHHGRRRVARVAFADGRALYYKPRPPALEAGLVRVADWLARDGCPLTPRFPRLLDCGDHGWSEAVAENPPDGAAAATFFLRLGALAALIGACGGTDCHRENIVAAGEHPVLVDAEPLLHPRIAASPDFSIAATEIFPRILAGPGGQTIFCPGFDGLPNTPAMPRLADHHGQVRAGAAAMADVLQTRADAFCSIVLPRLAACGRGRVILRPTSMYAAVMSASLAPRHIADADARHALFRRLRAYDDPEIDAVGWDRIHACEVAALERGDIPWFCADTSSGEIFAHDAGALARLRPFLADAREQFDGYLDSCRTLPADACRPLAERTPAPPLRRAS